MERSTAFATLAVVVAGAAVLTLAAGSPLASGGDTAGSTDHATDVEGLDTFNDSAAFESYVEAGGAAMGHPMAAPGRGEPRTVTATPVATEAASGDAAALSSSEQFDSDAAAEPRIGTTNVQERSIDEPDVLKTSGRHFYYAPRGSVPYRPPVEPLPGPERDRPATELPGDETSERFERPRARTHVVDASDPAAPERITGINASGRMLVVNDTLVVLERGGMVSYDISDPENPTREWSRSVNGSVVTARASGGQVYLVVERGVHRTPSCPVEPVEGHTVACEDIYHPERQVPVDATYTALSVAPANGSVTDAVSFVGTRQNTVVYMSAGSLYVTYTNPTDRSEAIVDALLAADEVPADVKERIRTVRSYDLSQEAVMAEVQYRIDQWLASLSPEERRTTREGLSESVQAYMQERARQLTTTGVVRVRVGGADGNGTSLAVDAHGTVPGRPLDQFSLDEHDGHLRIATTVPNTEGGSANDLYTLEAESLDRVGSVQGMAEDQRIYAVRYVGDRAYLVTFRQIDPFHVVDLSDPADPVELGLKELPGVSRYLHPISDDLILGVGEEDGRAKAVLFDVSDPTNPTIADSHVYDRRWSHVAGNHHAFTIDRRHGVFFMPAGGDGLVVDYTNQTLSTEATVETDGATRARYVGDYLYVFGQEEIVVVDETNWERETTLTLADE